MDAEHVAGHPRTLSDRARDALLAAEPDIGRLHADLMQELGLPAESATRLIYEIALRLNASLFPPITHIELVHTEGCNLACSYCFEKDMLGQKRMPPEVARAALDLLFDYSQNEPVLSITHFGGEPTLNFDGIRDATEYAEQKAAALGKSLKFDTTSNGVLFNEPMVAYFRDHDIRVLLSVDGLRESHDRFRLDKRGRGTFERVMAALALLKAHQPWIGVKMTVMPENARALYDDVRGLYDLGANHFIIGHATGVEWSAEAMAALEGQLAALYRWYKERPRDDLRIDDFEDDDDEAYFGCQAGRNSVAVTIRGEISPCSKIMGFGSQRLVGKLGDVTRGLTHLKTRTDLVDCAKLESACEAQGIAREFRGGCFAVNFGESGDLFQPSRQEHTLSLLKRSACSGCSGCG